MFKKIKDIIPSSLSRYGLDRQAQASFVCFIFKEAIKEKWGEEVSKNIQPLSFKNGVLRIKVSDSIMASEIQLNQFEITNKINKKIGKDIVKRLQFRIK